MARPHDKTGLRYGRLLVLERLHDENGTLLYKCQCDCGNVTYVKTNYLCDSNTVKSCGCVKKELLTKRRQEALDRVLGKKFGRLTVLEFQDKPGARKLHFLCQCDCGKKIVTTNDSLLSQHTISCGCYQREVVSKVKEMIGKKFGRLTVIKPVEEKASNGNYKFLCQCECGNTTIVTGGHLRTGTTISCGCAVVVDKTDIIGKKFGRLTVLSLDEVDKYIRYKCRCDCGNEIVTYRYALINGESQSCGCRQREVASKNINNYLGTVLKEKSRLDLMNTKLHVNNTSGRRGVSWNNNNQMWEAYIGVKGKRIKLGYFTEFDDAVKVREQAEHDMWEPTLNKYGRELE